MAGTAHRAGSGGGAEPAKVEPAAIATAAGAGNGAIAAALSGRIAVPVAVQRHLARGLHTNQPPKHKHSAGEADGAGSFAAGFEKEISELRAGLDGPGTTAAADLAEKRLRELHGIIESQLEIVNADTAAKAKWGAKLRQLRDQANSGAAKAQEVRPSRVQQEVTAKVETGAPAALNGIEAQALAAADAASEVVRTTGGNTTPPKVKVIAKRATDAHAQAIVIHGQLTSLAGEAAPYSSPLALAQSHQRAADSALETARRMAKIATDVEEGFSAAYTRRAQAIKTKAQAKEDKEAAEQAVASAEQLVGELERYQVELGVDAAEWRKEPTAIQSAIDEILADVATKVDDARRARAKAKEAFEAAAAALPLIEASEDAEVKGAIASFKTVRDQAIGQPAAAKTELQGLGQLRALAGQQVLEQLLPKVPDHAQLLGLLTALGAATAQRWLGSATIGAARALAMLATFTDTGLKALVEGLGEPAAEALVEKLEPGRIQELAAPAGLGLPLLKQLATSFGPSEIDTFASVLGLDPLKGFLGDVSASSLKGIGTDANQLQALLADVTSAQVKGLVDVLKEPKVKDLVSQLTPAEVKSLLAEVSADLLKRLDLTGAQLKDLLVEFTPAEVRTLAADLGDGALKDLFTKFTAAEIKAYRVAVGAARFKELIVDKKLKADALEKYKAPMLKTFIGAGGAAWAHVAGAPYLNGVGRIAGGHDEAAFLAFVNTLVGPPPQQPRATYTFVRGSASVYKVRYTTRANVVGSKTLISGLVGDAATWKARFSQAIWKSIRTLTFPTAAALYSASDDSGSAYEGYYTAGNEVDTIYPKI